MGERILPAFPDTSRNTDLGMQAIFGPSAVILSHAMLRNTTAEGFIEAYEYVRTKTRLLIYHRHLKITQVAKNKPWILPLMPVFKGRQIFSGIYKNILAVRILFCLQFNCQMWRLRE